MAKKKKNDDINNIGNDEKKSESSISKILSIMIALLIVVIWLALFAVLIKMDVGGFGSNVLSPVLKNVPVINRILPGYSAYQDTEGNQYQNLDQAMAKIQELENQIASMSSADTANSDYITQLEAENARLKVFEQNQKDFEKRVAEFDQNVVFNDKAPSIAEYKAYYEQINPTNAADLYQKVIEQLQVDQKVIDQADRLSKMDSANAAQILEVMTGDLDLVCKILENMKPAQSAAILEQMSSEYAAKITKKSSILQ
ncbi:MAG: hypothetical protein PWP24_1845 [Clostridiales bacterium]|nr:hypothetical protein [Clostridiales bacterium]